VTSRRFTAAACVVAVASLAFVSACSSSPKATTPPSSTSTSTSASAPPPSTSTPSTGKTVALGTNNPAQGDCTTDTGESATAVGSVVLTVTTSSFQAEVELRTGSPNTTYAVFLQQVPGSCPQNSANGGTLSTDAQGRGTASATVARVPGATTFFVQLVPAAAGPADYTSDRISPGS